MPRGLVRPSDFGICTRRTGCGRWSLRLRPAANLIRLSGVLHTTPSTPGVFRPPFAGLFGLHRLTSPAIPSFARLPNRRDHGGSQHPFGSGIPSLPRPYPLHYRAAFACSAVPLPPLPSPPLRSGYRRFAAVGRVGLTLL